MNNFKKIKLNVMDQMKMNVEGQLPEIGKMGIVPEITISYYPRIKPSELPKVTNSKQIHKLLLDNWNLGTIYLCEEFKIILLNRSGHVKGIYPMSKGGIHSTVVDLKLILLLAIEALACSVILCHNHPSDQINPSHADKELTQKVKKALELMDIKLIDHLIATPDNYFSFADEGFAIVLEIKFELLQRGNYFFALVPGFLLC